MNILMINYEFPPLGGGAGQANYEILRNLSNFPNLKINLLTSTDKPGLQIVPLPKIQTNVHGQANITIYKVGIRKKNLHLWKRSEVIQWLFRADKIYKQLIAQNHYDLAHAFFAFPSAWLCYRHHAQNTTYHSHKQLPYIISLRGSDVPGINSRLGLDYKLLGPLFKRIWKRSERIIACSNGLRMRAWNFLPNIDIQVIPNGVDTQKFHPASNIYNNTTTPAQLNTSHTNHTNPSSSLKLLTVGRLSSTKRIDLLIHTVAILRRQIPGISLTIAGSGALLPKLKQLTKHLQLQNNITFKGIIPATEMPQLYHQHNIYISASAQEGMSNAMLEAMASALPIITTPCEGTDELIENHHTGIIIPQPDPQHYVTEITKLTAQPSLITQMAQAARTKALLFSWTSVAQQYMQCYKEIINKTPNIPNGYSNSQSRNV